MTSLFSRLEFIIKQYQSIMDNAETVELFRWALDEREKYKIRLSNALKSSKTTKYE